MGLFENGMFANGTINIAKSMALAFWRGGDEKGRSFRRGS
jgi:hypothetical protein